MCAERIKFGIKIELITPLWSEKKKKARATAASGLRYIIALFCSSHVRTSMKPQSQRLGSCLELTILTDGELLMQRAQQMCLADCPPSKFTGDLSSSRNLLLATSVD